MVSLRKLGTLSKKFCKMESTCPEMSSVNVPCNWSVRWSYFKTVGNLRDFLSICECFDQMRMIIFGGDEMFMSM